MISEEDFIEMVMSFHGVEQTPHFERVGFKVQGRRMFATYLAKSHSANIFLSPEAQQIFCQAGNLGIYPVPNKWGEKGATTFELAQVSSEWVFEALRMAYEAVLKK